MKNPPALYKSDKNPRRSSLILLQSLSCCGEDTTHGGTRLQWACPPQKKRLKKVTVLNALNRTCLDSIQADLISTAEQF